jgi:hypothetical protein
MLRVQSASSTGVGRAGGRSGGNGKNEASPAAGAKKRTRSEPQQRQLAAEAANSGERGNSGSMPGNLLTRLKNFDWTLDIRPEDSERIAAGLRGNVREVAVVLRQPAQLRVPLCAAPHCAAAGGAPDGRAKKQRIYARARVIVGGGGGAERGGAVRRRWRAGSSSG